MDTGPSNDTLWRRLAIGWWWLIGAGMVALGVRDILSFEPLPQTLTPQNVGAFLELRRYFGVWPGWMQLVLGVAALVCGALFALRWVKMMPLPGEQQPAPPSD